MCKQTRGVTEVKRVKSSGSQLARRAARGCYITYTLTAEETPEEERARLHN